MRKQLRAHLRPVVATTLADSDVDASALERMSYFVDLRLAMAAEQRLTARRTG
jgi:hypothetical protein